MKRIFISFYQLSIIAIMALLLVACDHDDSSDMREMPNENGEYTYTLHLEADAPLFDDEAGTRATGSWANGSKIFLRFNNGSSYVTGSAVYNSSTGKWTISTNSSLSVNGNSTTCHAYHFKSSGAVSVSNNTISLDPKTACYYGAGTYSHPTSTDVYITVKLTPQTWRLRFSGSSGASITVTNSSDIYYNTKLDLFTGKFTSEKKNVDLSVGSNGYTPYIYGIWEYSYIDNDLYVKNGSNTYSRGISGDNLKEKESAYMTIPTQSNYSSNGWTKTDGTDGALQNLLTKPMGEVDVNMATATFSAIKSAVEKKYNIFSSTDGDTKYIWVRSWDNTNLPSYQGLNFYGFDFSDNQSEKSGDGIYRGILYDFTISKSQMSDPFVCYDRIIDDFKDMGITLTYRKITDSSMSAETDFVVKDHVSYSLTLWNHYNDNKDWCFEINVQYWGSAHIDSK